MIKFRAKDDKAVDTLLELGEDAESMEYLKKNQPALHSFIEVVKKRVAKLEKLNDERLEAIKQA